MNFKLEGTSPSLKNENRMRVIRHLNPLSTTFIRIAGMVPSWMALCNVSELMDTGKQGLKMLPGAITIKEVKKRVPS